MRIISIILIAFLYSSNASGQLWFEEPLVADSTIRGMKIRKITQTVVAEKWFMGPSPLTIEEFDSYGQRFISIKHNLNHRLVSKYEYDEKESEIIVTTTKYNWYKRDDTSVITNTEKYDLQKKYSKNEKPPLSVQYPSKSIYNASGQLLELIDTIKNGHIKVVYSYDEFGREAGTKLSITSDRRDMDMSGIDSTFYNTEGRIYKTIGVYTGSSYSPKIEPVSNRVETVYQYFSNGLLKEKTVVSTMQNSNEKPTQEVYKYEYLFFDF